MKIAEIGITKGDVEVLEDVLLVLKKYCVSDDGKQERFPVDSLCQLIKDFREALNDKEEELMYSLDELKDTICYLSCDDMTITKINKIKAILGDSNEK